MKILLFLVIESFYFIFIVSVKPHTDNMFNLLEYFNEILVMLLAYLMITYSGVGPEI